MNLLSGRYIVRSTPDRFNLVGWDRIRMKMDYQVGRSDYPRTSCIA